MTGGGTPGGYDDSPASDSSYSGSAPSGGSIADQMTGGTSGGYADSPTGNGSYSDSAPSGGGSIADSMMGGH